MNDVFKMAQQAYHALSIAESELKRLYKENAELRQALAQPVDAVNTTQKRVDETAKREHEPVAWVKLETWLSGETWPDDCFSHFECTDFVPLYTAPPRNCDNCESLRRAAWDRINELEAKLEERENNVLFNDVLKSFKLYAESLGIKIKEKNT